MPRIRKPKKIDQDVWSKTIERLEYLFKLNDTVRVSFSGGKDSTAVLNATLKVADGLGRKIIVDFFDEEAIHPPTIEYVHRVKERVEKDGHEMNWWCLQWKHRNACSNTQPYWYCWNDEEKEKWVRDMPDFAITEHPLFEKGMTFQDFGDLYAQKEDGMTAILTGVRTQESIRRLRAVSMKKNDNYITRKGHFMRAHPIYDWSSGDVWIAVRQFDWDYNRTYDIMNRTSLFNNFLSQRVCPPFGEEPLRGLWLYAECFPDMWHKMLGRVDGVATAWRYSNTELYGAGKDSKPDDMTYKEYIPLILDTYDTETKNEIKKHLNTLIKRHTHRTASPIPEIDPNPLTGLSWKFMTKICLRGDLKGRVHQKLSQNMEQGQQKEGINLAQAVAIYGRPEFKKEWVKDKTDHLIREPK